MATVEDFGWTIKGVDKIFARKWLVDDKSKAVIILVHGLGEHIGRYEHVAGYFNQNNISVYGFDHRGHGKSSGKRGHIASNQDFISDIDTLIEMVKNENSGVPIFLYGHSMGGNMVLFYALSKKPDIKGIICTSPGLGAGEPVPPAKLLAAKTMKTLMPAMTINNGLDVNNLSHNPKVIKDYREDPLVHPMISLKLAMDIFSNGDWAVDNAEKFPIPLLLLIGSDDHIINLDKIKQFAENAPSNLLTFEIFSGFYHELHNEFEQEKVLRVILDWINKLNS
jgi:alpha-beta hydrolase superfamily lysophospholipase